jgi:hypothetical protein
MDKFDSMINFAIDSVKNRFPYKLVHYSCIDTIIMEVWKGFASKADMNEEDWNVQFVCDTVFYDLENEGWKINYSDIQETI